MEPTNWAPEHSDALREHLAKGLSFSQIAKAINSRFNTTYSRNAALGRARRMGLAGEERPGATAFTRTPQGASSSARDLVSPSTPAFAAA